MSTASSPAWTLATQIARNTRAALSRRPPVTGTPRSLTVAACVGALAGSALGACAGALTGPAGMVVGVALGGAGGTLFLRILGINSRGPGREPEPYYASPHTFEDYGPAYRFGRETISRYRGRRFEEVEPELENLWRTRQEARRLSWDKARNAVRRIWSVWSPG